MRRKVYSESQILKILKEYEQGITATELENNIERVNKWK